MRLISAKDVVVVGGKIPVKATDGAAPYTYEIVSGGGLIENDEFYVAPNESGQVTLKATDSLGEEATLELNVLTHLQLVCEILKEELFLEDDQVYIFNQTILSPKDLRLYIQVGIRSSKVFGSKRVGIENGAGNGMESLQRVSVRDVVEINIVSKSFTALENKEDIVLALASQTSQDYQVAHAFHIARLPSEIQNLSELERPEIAYRFNFSFNLLYSKHKIKAQDYYDSFNHETIFNK